MSATPETKVQSTTQATQSIPKEIQLSYGSRRPAVLLPAGGLLVGLVLLALGTALKGNASFAEDYVARQLAEQRIVFPTVDALAHEERQTPCLVRNAGQPLTTGKQAECYANFFIGRHLKLVAGGKTFSELRGVQTSLREQVSQAQANNDPALADLQRQLNDVTGKRQSLFEGQTMRGLLLTSYGFSELGVKAEQGASAAFLTAGLLLPMSAGFLLRGLVRSRRS